MVLGAKRLGGEIELGAKRLGCGAKRPRVEIEAKRLGGKRLGGETTCYLRWGTVFDQLV